MMAGVIHYDVEDAAASSWKPHQACELDSQRLNRERPNPGGGAACQALVSPATRATSGACYMRAACVVQTALGTRAAVCTRQLRDPSVNSE